MRNQDDAVRLLQTLSGGFGFGRGDHDQHAYTQLFASGYSPQETSRTRGYNFDGVFRPMTADELERYTLLRGQAFKEELQGVNVEGLPEPEARRLVQAAYQRANQRALGELGVVQTRPARQTPASAPGRRQGEAISQLPTRVTIPQMAGPKFAPSRSSLRLRRSRLRRPSFARPRSLRTLRLRRPTVRRKRL